MSGASHLLGGLKQGARLFIKNYKKMYSTLEEKMFNYATILVFIVVSHIFCVSCLVLLWAINKRHKDGIQ